MGSLTEGLGLRTDVAVLNKMLNVLIHIESLIGMTDEFIGF